MEQRGFIPVIVLVGILVVVSVIGIYTDFGKNINLGFYNKQSEKIQESTSSAAPMVETRAATPTANPKYAPKKSSNTPTPVAQKTPTPTPTVSPSTTTSGQQKKNTCDINVIYGKLGGDSRKQDPLLVTLTYSFSAYNNTYMTGAQWDFDGNNSWDTDLKQSNGTVEHTYSQGGTYNVRLQVQASDGSMTDVCNRQITVTQGITISLSGQVYNDLNCNKSKDTGEGGVSGQRLSVVTSEGLIYEDLTTDSNGNYSFSRNIKADESLSLYLAPIDHAFPFSPTSPVTLNAQNRSATIDISKCP